MIMSTDKSLLENENKLFSKTAIGRWPFSQTKI